MATRSETYGERTVWTVCEDGGEAQVVRESEWPHYLVTCRGGTWIVDGDDFGRAHAAALAAIRATLGEEQHATGEWQQIGSGHWTREVGGLRAEVHCRRGATRWSVTALLSLCGHKDVCVAGGQVDAADVGGAREDADYWLRSLGVIS